MQHEPYYKGRSGMVAYLRSPTGIDSLALRMAITLSGAAPELHRPPRRVAATRHARRVPQSDISQREWATSLCSPQAQHYTVATTKTDLSNIEHGTKVYGRSPQNVIGGLISKRHPLKTEHCGPELTL
jgi:hypothetical protein